jgi:glycerate kinase
MNILIAPNAFKNSLPAREAAEAIRKGLEQSALSCSCRCFPIADGGDGTAQLITEYGGGIFESATVRDPLGRRIDASFGMLRDTSTAVIEMAAASGLRLLQKTELDPLHASTFGTGELIRAALDRGASKILVGVGGSATVDGACGILAAMGMQFLDGVGKSIEAIPENIPELGSVDITSLEKRPCAYIILCDVNNPLLGPNGAAAVFGPQKGASKEMVVRLERALEKFSAVTQQFTGIPIGSLQHGGAAGGVAAGLHAYLGATLVNGIDYFLNTTGFDAALAETDIVITGEGGLDEQTLNGKGPYGVAIRAKKKRIPVIALAGDISAPPESGLHDIFDAMVSIDDPADRASGIRPTEKNLVTKAREIGNLLHDKKLLI